MNKKTHTLTLSALFSALSVISLYIASVWPTGLLGLTAVASLFVAAAVVEAGVRPGLYVYIVVSVIGFLILPNRSASLLFIVFFGYYPIVKCLFEQVGAVFLQWILKLAVFNLSLSSVYFLLSELIFDISENMPGTALLYICGNIVFAIFDHGLSKLLRLYMDRISKILKKGK